MFSSYSFRFLLHMYTCLGEEDEALAERGLCDYLRERIYKVCSGQLAWSFNVARFQDRQWSQYHLVSGPVPSNLSGWSTGTEHVLKLYDYLKTFPNERLRIIRYIVLRVSSWLNGLAAHRDAKSQLWAFSSSSVQVSWQNLEYRSDEAFELPKYFLEIQVWIWKALSSIERILEEELNDQQHSQHEIFTNDIWNKMKSAAEELKIAFPVGTLRNLILERFTDGQTHNPESKGGGNKFILFSRCAKHNKPRTQLYWHSDGAFEVSNDGFFNDANGNLSQAWLNTLASQGVKRSKKTWKTSTNLSMSILMKTYEQFLNETCRTALKLANPIEQILSLVASSGMILTHEDMDPTKIPYIPEYHAEAVWVLMSSHDWRTRQSQEAR